MKIATELVRRSAGLLRDAAPLTTPIYETTTFVFETAAGSPRLQRRAVRRSSSTRATATRRSWPSSRSSQSLERAESALLLSSGQAATTTALLGLLSAGDEIVCSVGDLRRHAAPDGRPAAAIRHPRRGSSPLDELRTPGQVIGPATRLLWFESPINPTLRCVDIAAVAAACRERGVISVIDNTFASPINQQPLALGRRPRHAQRDEVPERPQRRHRRACSPGPRR